MKILLAATEQGGLGKSKGSAKAPEEIVKIINCQFEKIEIVHCRSRGIPHSFLFRRNPD